jgi:hypothetical protein
MRAVLVVTFFSFVSACVVFVSENGTDSQTCGSSWATACRSINTTSSECEFFVSGTVSGFYLPANLSVTGFGDGATLSCSQYSGIGNFALFHVTNLIYKCGDVLCDDSCSSFQVVNSTIGPVYVSNCFGATVRNSWLLGDSAFVGGTELLFENCTFVRAEQNAVKITSVSDVTFSGCIFLAESHGLSVLASTLRIENSVFEGITGFAGGALFLAGDTQSAVAIIQNCTFRRNSVYDRGGKLGFCLISSFILVSQALSLRRGRL